MSKHIIIGNGEVLTPRERFYGGIILNGPVISGVYRGAQPPALDGSFIDAAGHWILPGLIDLHLHGANGVDFNRAPVSEIKRAAYFLAVHCGVTAFLPTVMTDSWERMAEAVAVLCRARQEIAAPEILGVHLEGPFLNPAYKGAHPAEHLCLPLPGLLEQIMEAAGGSLAMVTLAPELPGGLEAVSYFTRQGVVAALGHSGAPFDLVRQAVALGLKHVVHTYSGMAGFHHRRPGPLGASLVLDELSTELVADGVHCHPAAVKLLCRVKKPQQLVLVTDASPGAGLPEGEYTLGGAKLDIKNGCSRLADGTLAGSTLTMNRALAGAVEMGGLPLEEAVAAATVNPAAVLGLETRKGTLEAGKDADVVVMSRAYEVLLTVCKGVVMQNCLGGK